MNRAVPSGVEGLHSANQIPLRDAGVDFLSNYNASHDVNVAEFNMLVAAQNPDGATPNRLKMSGRQLVAAGALALTLLAGCSSSDSPESETTTTIPTATTVAPNPKESALINPYDPKHELMTEGYITDRFHELTAAEIKTCTVENIKVGKPIFAPNLFPDSDIGDSVPTIQLTYRQLPGSSGSDFEGPVTVDANGRKLDLDSDQYLTAEVTRKVGNDKEVDKTRPIAVKPYPDWKGDRSFAYLKTHDGSTVVRVPIDTSKPGKSTLNIKNVNDIKLHDTANDQKDAVRTVSQSCGEVEVIVYPNGTFDIQEASGRIAEDEVAG